MKESIQKKIDAIKAKAKLLDKTTNKPVSAIRNGSSLHMIIKTKEQAEAFLKDLRAAGTK